MTQPPEGLSVPEPSEPPFLMSVEDVFRPRRTGSGPRQGRQILRPGGQIPRRGGLIVATGRIERGLVRRGDLVEIVGLDADPTTVVVVDIEHGRVPVAEAREDMNVGLLLPGRASAALKRGQVLATPGSISAHTAFTATIDVLSEEHGGTEVVSGERLQFHVRSATVLGTVTLPEDADMVRPLHRAEVTVRLDHSVALEAGHCIPFRHHARAAGLVTVKHITH
ncbi:EF-Tu/IF-2/RF-3 family GTPase [Streptomyces aureus]